MSENLLGFMVFVWTMHAAFVMYQWLPNPDGSVKWEHEVIAVLDWMIKHAERRCASQRGTK